MPILESFVILQCQNLFIHLKLNVMKTLDEFENALLSCEYVHAGNGFVIVHFYPAMRDAVCGLISACVEICIPIDACGNYHRSSSVCTIMEAYQVYESIFESYKCNLA